MGREQNIINSLRRDPAKPDRTAPTVIVHAAAPKKRRAKPAVPTLVTAKYTHELRLTRVENGMKETCGESTGAAVMKLLQMYLDKAEHRADLADLLARWEGFK